MDALRLIRTTRHALADARSAADVLAEARQAALLGEAVGASLAEHEDDGELALLGQLLAAAGAHAAGCLDRPGGASPPGAPGAPGPPGPHGRAARLTELGALDPLLAGLGELLHESAESLVALACGADTESLYWTCIDGIDSGAECRELVADLHRVVRKAEGIADPAAEQPDGAWDPDVGDAHGVGDGGGAVDAAGTDWEPDTDPLPEDDDGAAGLPAQAAERGTPLLVVRLGPPSGCGCGRYREREVESPSVAVPVPVAVAVSAGEAEGRRGPDDCSSARSALTEARSSCICSSRLLGAAGAGGTSTACGAAGASDQGSDMRGPLRISSAV